MKLGWRVVELSREQVDLGLYCLALLQAESGGPFSFFCVGHGEGREEGKAVWVEWRVMLVASSREGSAQSLELSVFNLCQREMLPLLQSFFASYLDWSYMCSADYEDSKVVRLFEQRVVEPVRLRLQKFRAGRDCLQ